MLAGLPAEQKNHCCIHVDIIESVAINLLGKRMKAEFQFQHPKTPATGTLAHLFRSKIHGNSYDKVCVAVAYMTISGLRSLLTAFGSEFPHGSKWLIGLDDFITQPGAIDAVLGLPGVEVRCASFNAVGARFHPKVYIFQQNGRRQGLAILGSANLTAQGLSGNGEANVLLQLQNKVDSSQVDVLWRSIWAQGSKYSSEDHDKYKKQYYVARMARPKPTSAHKPIAAGMVILSSDAAEIDPLQANTCWIECGYVTALGREVELKSEQGIFFGLAPTGEAPAFFDFVVSSGAVVRLRLKFQANHMWRLQLTNEVPEVAAGLRPVMPTGALDRSPYVLIIDRTNTVNVFDLRFIKLNSKAFRKIVIDSKSFGTYGKTIARQYGWC